MNRELAWNEVALQRFTAIRAGQVAFALIALFFLAQLIYITTPPLDLADWREADTTSVARNLDEESLNIFKPRIDIRRQYTGITGMEFPLYNFAIFSVNKALGFEHWHGRLVSAVASTVGLIFFYLLMKARYQEWAAVLAAFFMASSTIYFYYSRTAQPDATMVAFSVAALYFAQRYGKSGLFRDFLITCAVLSVGALIKPPAAFVGPAALLLMWPHIRQLLAPHYIVAGLVIVVLPNAAWYVWADHLSDSYGLGHYFYDNFSSESWSILSTPNFWVRMFVLRVANSVLSVVGCAFAVSGLLWCLRRRDVFPLVWLLGVGLFLVVWSHKSQPHVYYSLPMVPPMALLAGAGLHWVLQYLKPQYMGPIVFAVALAAVVQCGLRVAPWYELHNEEFLRLESIMDAHVPRDERIVVNAGGEPTMMYFTHRKGWTMSGARVTDDFLDEARGLGAGYLVVWSGAGKPAAKELTAPIYTDASFTVYDLTP